MNFKKASRIVLLFLLVFCQPVKAQTYEPGRGILLPKRGADAQKDDKKTIEIIRNRNTSPTIVNKQGITVPNQATQGVLTPDRQNNDNSQKLTSAYAAHLYTSICSQDYRNRLAPITEENLDKKRMWSDIQTSCKCLSNQILAVIPASDLADYVMYTYGAQNSAQPDPQASAYFAQKGGRIDQLLFSGALQKKCGFLN